MQTMLSPHPGIRIYHKFRSKVLGIAYLDGHLVVCTERGIYKQTKENGRWRKVKFAEGKP